jgi:predicted metal-dependent phosphoesterase TrpH
MNVKYHREERRKVFTSNPWGLPAGKRPGCAGHRSHGPKPLKVDLHLHTADDPLDRVGHTTKELILKAADVGFDVISITNHDRLTFSPDLFDFARERGLLLIPGIEMTIENRHVLVLNPPRNREVSGLSSLSGIRRPETLVVAPHPYFPGIHSLNGHLLKHLHLFDALEYCHFYSPRINFNHRVLQVSRSNGAPLIGNSDSHFLSQLGTTYSTVYAEKNILSLFEAIRAGRVEVVTRPLSPFEIGSIAKRFLKMKLRGRPGTSPRWSRPGIPWEETFSAPGKPRKEAA